MFVLIIIFYYSNLDIKKIFKTDESNENKISEVLNSKIEINFKNVNPREANNIIKKNINNSEFIILDVRTAKEFSDGYIASAENIDFYFDSFKEDLNKLNKEKEYLIYCRSGNRSGRAFDIMKDLGFTNVYNMEGGILEWEKEGLPIVK